VNSLIAVTSQWGASPSSSSRCPSCGARDHRAIRTSSVAPSDRVLTRCLNMHQQQGRPNLGICTNWSMPTGRSAASRFRFAVYECVQGPHPHLILTASTPQSYRTFSRQSHPAQSHLLITLITWLVCMCERTFGTLVTLGSFRRLVARSWRRMALVVPRH